MEKTLEQKVSNKRRLAGWLIPLVAKYDIVRETEKLQKNPALKEKSYLEIEKALKETYQEEKLTLYSARLADSADKVTSFIGPYLEAAGVGMGLAPGWFAVNFGEEIIEQAFKMPFTAIIGKDPLTRDKAYNHLLKEAVSFGIPVLPDIYEFFANSYVDTANEIIREKALEKILRGEKK